VELVSLFNNAAGSSHFAAPDGGAATEQQADVLPVTAPSGASQKCRLYCHLTGRAKAPPHLPHHNIKRRHSV
jgi:hypothetical protein